MTARYGYMFFAAEPPLVGLDPHPAYAPDSPPATRTADGWFAAYGALASREEAEAEARADLDDRKDASEDGDLADAGELDIVLEVAVHDDGRLDVFGDGACGARVRLATYTAAEIHAAFAMIVP